MTKVLRFLPVGSLGPLLNVLWRDSRYRWEMANATLSVVVPAFNESEYIETCIEALIAQGEYVDEIIVVDNNSSDNTSELIKKYQISCPKLRLLCESRPGWCMRETRGLTRLVENLSDVSTPIRSWGKAGQLRFTNSSSVATISRA